MTIVRTEDDSPKWIRPVSADQGGAVSCRFSRPCQPARYCKGLMLLRLHQKDINLKMCFLMATRLEIVDKIQRMPSLIEQLLSVEYINPI